MAVFFATDDASFNVALAAALANGAGTTDTINLAAGNYTTQHDINSSVIINGPQAGVNGNAAGRGFGGTEAVLSGGIQIIAANVTINGVEITGQNNFGGAITQPTGIYVPVAGSNATIQDTLFNGTTAAFGLTVAATGLTVTLNAFAGYAEHIEAIQSTTGTINNNLFVDQAGGAGIFTESTAVLISANTFQNLAGAGPAVFSNPPGSADISAQVLANNNITPLPGGAHVINIVPFGAGPETIVGTVFDDAIFTSDDPFFGGAGHATSLNLRGLAGNDELDGGLANDILDGGPGNDNLFGQGGIDTASYLDSLAGVTVSLGLQGAQQNTIGAGLDNLNGFANLTGSNFGDKLTGDGAVNTLDGGQGDDTLAGLAGADVLIGGAGTDTADYSASAAGVTVNLATGTGLGGDAQGDTLFTIENLIGSTQADTLTGDGFANIFFGNGGEDTMTGGGGDDTYVVDSAGDVVTEIAGGGTNDTVYASINYTLTANVENLVLFGGAVTGIGNVLDNYLYGNGLDNILDGDGGNDIMLGKAGNDTYVVNSAGDLVIENPGEGTNDTIYSSVDGYQLANNVETLVLFGSAVTGLGNSQDNYLYGNGLDNVLDGDGGNDIMLGKAGNDTYVVNSAGDLVIENPGEGANDTVYSSLDGYQLTNNVENLVLFGNAVTGLGNSQDNVLYGNGLDNVLDGDGGNDAMLGKAGNDTYVVNSPGDTVIENAGEGTNDQVYSSIDYTLTANVETLVLFGGATTGNGNNLNNFVYGNALANTLNGQGGADVLTGGAGNDTFQFSKGQANGDSVVDFNGNGAAAGDSFEFLGYGTQAQGATFVQLNSTQWQINAFDGSAHDVITLLNGAAVNSSDFFFH